MPRRSHQRVGGGASLLELIIVLFIISIMASLLFPALQAARAKAASTACQNNIRQVGFGLSRYIDVMKRFPQPNHWTVDILKWIEERPLANQLTVNGIPKGAPLPRPKLFQCAAQPDFTSSVANVGICHYVLIVDRPLRADGNGNVHWIIQDRPQLSDDESLDPWYIGPEMTFAQQQTILATKKGPHPAGIYYTNGGQTLGGN
ncbi:MAG TPA: DUF1559 domain-containing protein [Lacipirellulaceae bacterium]|nr:DUF1559 domain-containing protein [Lacipirellulaceae bacterium]